VATGGASRPKRPRGPQLHSSLSLGWSRTDLAFSGGSFAAQKTAVAFGTDLVLGDRFSLQIAAGSIVDGSLRRTSGRASVPVRALGPGWLGALSASWTVVAQKGWVPFVILSATVAGNGAALREEPTARPGARGRFYGVDFRFGASVGETFAGVLSPYLALRVFGGPAIMAEGGSTSVGTDKYHVQPALGAVVLLGRGVDLFAEGAPVLERSLSLGLGLRY
jgi:hypothetical protein